MSVVQEAVEACTPEPKKAPIREDGESSPEQDTPVQQPRFGLWVRCMSTPQSMHCVSGMLCRRRSHPRLDSSHAHVHPNRKLQNL